MDYTNGIRMEFLAITQDNKVIARGIWMPDCVTYFADDGRCAASYPDTGVFILLSGSSVRSVVPEKLSRYVSNGVTTKAIAFQSRNFAAEFVLGHGSTNYWK